MNAEDALIGIEERSVGNFNSSVLTGFEVAVANDRSTTGLIRLSHPFPMIEHMFRSRVAKDAVEAMRAAARDLVSARIEPTDADSVIDSIRQLAEVERLVEAAQVALLSTIDRNGLHQLDGHVSAKKMMRHVAKLLPGAAAGREKSMKAMRDLLEVAERFRSGQLGVDQMRRIGRAHANPRVRDAMPDFQDLFLKHARRLSYADFDRAMQRFEQSADEDGPQPSNEAARYATIKPAGLDGDWELRAQFGPLSGLSLKEIFAQYEGAELDADWEKARAEHGDDASGADLPRTHQQRSADALWQIFQDAATNENSRVPVGFVHNIVWKAETLEHLTHIMFGDDAAPLELDDYLCRSIDGYNINPRDAAARVFIDQLRRVVIDAAGVVADQGRARTFTGSARLAVQLGETHCVWPGCDRPTSECEIDHNVAHSRGGRTTPGNGAPLCGRHNQIKESGYRLWRDPGGTWHVARPDGTRIE